MTKVLKNGEFFKEVKDFNDEMCQIVENSYPGVHFIDWSDPNSKYHDDLEFNDEMTECVIGNDTYSIA